MKNEIINFLNNLEYFSGTPSRDIWTIYFNNFKYVFAIDDKKNKIRIFIYWYSDYPEKTHSIEEKSIISMLDLFSVNDKKQILYNLDYFN